MNVVINRNVAYFILQIFQASFLFNRFLFCNIFDPNSQLAVSMAKYDFIIANTKNIFKMSFQQIKCTQAKSTPRAYELKDYNIPQFQHIYLIICGIIMAYIYFGEHETQHSLLTIDINIKMAANNIIRTTRRLSSHEFQLVFQ